MAIHESKHRSDLDKRFRQLRAQIYGKQGPTQPGPDSTKSSVYSISSVDTPSKVINNQTSHISDIDNLYKSLTKIALLSSLAIGSQLVLYFMITHRIVLINF